MPTLPWLKNSLLEWLKDVNLHRQAGKLLPVAVLQQPSGPQPRGAHGFRDPYLLVLPVIAQLLLKMSVSMFFFLFFWTCIFIVFTIFHRQRESESNAPSIYCCCFCELQIDNYSEEPHVCPQTTVESFILHRCLFKQTVNPPAVIIFHSRKWCPESSSQRKKSTLHSTWQPLTIYCVHICYENTPNPPM